MLRSRQMNYAASLCAGVSLLLVTSATSLSQAVQSDAAATPPRIGVAQPHARTPGTVRLAAYNLENFFDNKDDPSLSGKEDDMLSVKPEAEKAALAGVIRRLDPDILACEEVESYDALIEFREAYLKDAGYRYVQSIDVGAERGIEQAVMSRYPIVHAEVWPNLDLHTPQPRTVDGHANPAAGQPLLCRRSPLCVTIEIPAAAAPSAPGASHPAPYRLTLLVVHQKSGRNFAYWREAESAEFVRLVHSMEERDHAANIAVLGDFNATLDQPSVQSYIAAGLSDVCAAHSQTDPRWITHASGHTIDHILVNANLKHEIVADSEFVLGTPQLKPEDDWRTAKKPQGYASDHLPVAVDITPVD